MSESAGVYYNGNRLIPAPLISISKRFNKSADGAIIGSTFDIELNGYVLSWRGSPRISGIFWTGSEDPPDTDRNNIDGFEQILRKQEALRQLFNKDNEGKVLDIQPCNGTAPITCNPRINGISFPSDIWYDRCNYTISLETDILTGSVIGGQGEDSYSDYLEDATESWNMEFAEEPENEVTQHTFRLSHNISAKGKRVYTSSASLSKEAWEQARSYVQSRIGYDADYSAPVGEGYSGYNYIRNETSDILGGSYSIQETWLVAKSPTIEEFTVTSTRNAEEGLTHVTIEGSIRGLESSYFTSSSPYSVNIMATKWQSASGKFDTVYPEILNRAQIYSQSTLNPEPKNFNVGRNPVLGIINYSYEYDNSPSNCIQGALSESIVISDRNPADVFAKIGVLGRAIGPVLQDIGTVTEATRTLSVELVMPPYTGSACPASALNITTLMNRSPRVQVEAIKDAIRDNLELVYTQVFVNQDDESWDWKKGRYSRTVSWTYGSCG